MNGQLFVLCVLSKHNRHILTQCVDTHTLDCCVHRPVDDVVVIQTQ